MSSSSSSGSNTDDVTEIIVASIALLFSVLAFATTTFQALQQHFASAAGYYACSEQVIGKWAQFTHRRMRWSDFRMEVSFEVPVIFVAKPENEKGPLGENKTNKIIKLDGDAEENLKYTSDWAKVEKKTDETKRQLVHTADNEKATWYALLMAIYRMENESRAWQRGTLGYNPPNGTSPPHGLVVCFQRKRRTWDGMHKDLGKPYATTTISHFVEMMGMLGIYWKEFDLNKDKYRAQGNGFAVYGSYVNNLGITFLFQKISSTWFQTNRVVPNYSVKKLCFGYAPTIFHEEKEQIYADEPKDMGTLQLGSFAEIAQTLMAFGCDTRTVKYFGKHQDQARHSHIFPIPFEILGMVGELLHVKDTAFRMLPNPTIFHWDTSSFSLSLLAAEFSAQTQTPALEGLLPKGCQINHKPQADVDREYRNETSETQLMGELTQLRTQIEECDNYLKQQELFELVKQVLCVHIQEVLGVLNCRSNTELDDSKDATKGTSRHPAGHPRSTRHRDGALVVVSDETDDIIEDNPIYVGDVTMRDIDSASFSDRHSLLMEMYVRSIRERVVQIVCEQALAGEHVRARRASVASRVTADTGAAHLQSNAQTNLRCKVNRIWCTLVFRMLCWLQLHDFHRKDVQVSKSDVYGSRMPVYIV